MIFDRFSSNEIQNVLRISLKLFRIFRKQDSEWFEIAWFARIEFHSETFARVDLKDTFAKATRWADKRDARSEHLSDKCICILFALFTLLQLGAALTSWGKSREQNATVREYPIISTIHLNHFLKYWHLWII